MINTKAMKIAFPDVLHECVFVRSLISSLYTPDVEIGVTGSSYILH